MTKRDGKNFDLTLLLSAFLVIALSLFIFITVNFPKTETKASETLQYWVSYGPLGTPGSTVDTASELLSSLSSSQNQAKEIARWVDGGWETHPKDMPFNNFSIKAGEGYVILFDKLPTLNYYSKLPFTPLTILTYDLFPGYNFLSIPKGLTAKYKDLESLCLAIKKQSGTPISLAYNTGQNYVRYDSQNYWTYHYCGTSQDNAPVVPGIGYMVRVETKSTFKI